MATQQGSSAGGELKRFGWQAIELTVPADWELVTTQGKYESGYVALADNEGVRLQLRWDSDAGKVDASEPAGRHIRLIRKAARKAGTDAKVSRDLSLTSLRGKQIECYGWEADGRGLGMVSRCEECKRIVHVVLLGAADGPLRKLARTVFSSLKDHPEDGRLLWKFFDLEFSSPDNLSLRRQALQTGCIQMVFAGRCAELAFERVSLAQVVLASKSLRQWVREFHASELKHWFLDISEARVRGHPGLTMRGRPPLILNPGRLIGRPRELRLACWHCPETNRLFVVRQTALRGRQEGFERAIEGLKCCPEG